MRNECPLQIVYMRCSCRWRQSKLFLSLSLLFFHSIEYMHINISINAAHIHEYFDMCVYTDRVLYVILNVTPMPHPLSTVHNLYVRQYCRWWEGNGNAFQLQTMANLCCTIFISFSHFPPSTTPSLHSPDFGALFFFFCCADPAYIEFQLHVIMFNDQIKSKYYTHYTWFSLLAVVSFSSATALSMPFSTSLTTSDMN